MRVNAYVAPILVTYVYIYKQVKLFSWNESIAIVVGTFSGRSVCHFNQSSLFPDQHVQKWTKVHISQIDRKKVEVEVNNL